MTAPYTAAELAAILARAEKATPGPWSTEKPHPSPDGWATGVIVAAVWRGQNVYANPPGGSFPAADQNFIAAARTDVPRLVAELTRARESLREYGSHHPLCAVGDATRPGAACDCGLRAALGEEPADGDTER